MANIVEQMVDAIETRMTTVLGDGWTELDYKITVEQNSFRGNYQRFACVPLDATTATGITKNYTVDHNFQLILTQDYRDNGYNDAPQRASMFNLYDKLDDILKDIIYTKAGLPNLLLNIETFTIEVPEYLEDDNVAVLRKTITIKYRQALT